MKQTNKMIQHIYPKGKLIKTFTTDNWIEFLLIKDKKTHQLIWLPSTLTKGIKFTITGDISSFITIFNGINPQYRITYLLENYINSVFQDLDPKTYNHLQNTFNHGVHI